MSYDRRRRSISWSRPRSMERSGRRSCPVEIGKEYTVNITGRSRRGDGIAKIQGFVIFVADAKLGDHVKIRITRIGRTSAEAEIVK